MTPACRRWARRGQRVITGPRRAGSRPGFGEHPRTDQRSVRSVPVGGMTGGCLQPNGRCAAAERARRGPDQPPAGGKIRADHGVGHRSGSAPRAPPAGARVRLRTAAVRVPLEPVRTAHASADGRPGGLGSGRHGAPGRVHRHARPAGAGPHTAAGGRPLAGRRTAELSPSVTDSGRPPAGAGAGPTRRTPAQPRRMTGPSAMLPTQWGRRRRAVDHVG